MTDEEILLIVEGRIKGRVVQFRRIEQINWEDCLTDHIWNFHDLKYRLKPLPRIFYINIDINNKPIGVYRTPQSAFFMRTVAFSETIKVIEVIEEI